MRRLFWLALDNAGHAIPWLRFGRVRYAICIKAEAYRVDPPGYDWTDDDSLSRGDIKKRMLHMEPVEVVGSPNVVVTSTWPVFTGPQTWASGRAVNLTYRAPFTIETES